MINSDNFSKLYDKYYKAILVIPVALVLIALVYLFVFYQNNGDIIYKDVSLSGGTTVTVFDSENLIGDIELKIKSRFPDTRIRQLSDFRTGNQIGFSIETSSDKDEVKAALEEILGYELNEENSSTEFSGTSLSQGFYKQLRIGVILAFVFMGLVVFIIFRTAIPSLAVILAAFGDIVLTLAVVDLLGMRVSTAGIIAFLMLIGYSVDTDILLTSRVLRNRENSINQRIWGAFKTGITMTIASIVAVAISLAVIYSISETLKQIFFIMTLGLLFDIMNTWIMNASILKWYAEAKKL